MLGKIYGRQGRPDDCAHIETELADRRARGEYIPHACDVILATGRADVPGLRRALQGCIDEETTWLRVRMGPGPSLETFRRDPAVARLLDVIYDGAGSDHGHVALIIRCAAAPAGRSEPLVSPARS